MVNSNRHHSEIAPTDKGKAYKMKLKAIKRQQCERTDLTFVSSGQKLNGKTSREILVENSEDSYTQIQRYIRLTYLDEETQKNIVDRIDETEAFAALEERIKGFHKDIATAATLGEI